MGDMYCDYCGKDAELGEWEAAAQAYDATYGPSGYDERCPDPKCEEPRRAQQYDDYYPEPDPEPEPSPLDVIVAEIFQAGDEESLAG